MPSIQIKDVPSDVHAELRRRAGRAGKSLQEYLLAMLSEEASHPPLDDLLERAGGRAGGTAPFRAAVEILRGSGSMIVVDASVVAPALADDGDDGDRARARLRR